MPVIFIGAAPSRTVYETVSSGLDMRTDRPEGLVLHAASEEPGGTVRTVTVWETEEQARAFERERLLPAMGAAAHDHAAGEAPAIYEPFDYVA